MSVLNATIFGAVAAVLIAGADYKLTQKKHEGADYSVKDHLAFRAEGMLAAVGIGEAAPEEAPKPVICVKKGGAKECAATS
jgi:hypothetical protein